MAIDIISFLNATEFINVVNGTSAAVAEMTVAEAVESTGAVVKGGMEVFNVIKGGAAASAAVSGGTAEAITAFEAAGGAFSASGAATASASAAGNFTVIETFGGATATAGVASVSIPTALAICSPLIGAAIGVGLYELAPEFWTKVSQTLLPFCWDNTENIPVVVDENNQAYIAKDVVDALKELFDETFGQEGKISDLETGYSQLLTASQLSLLLSDGTIGMITADPGVTLGGAYITDDGASYVFLASAREPGKFVYSHVLTRHEVASTFTHNGKKVYWTWVSVGSAVGSYRLISPASIRNGQPSPEGATSWTMEYGEQGRDYSDTPGVGPFGGRGGIRKPEIGVATDPAGNTMPYYPVYIPVGDPFVSTDPQIQPDPQAPTLPEVLPEIIPNTIPEIQYPESLPIPDPAERTNPLPTPVVNPEPNLDPEADPSAQPEEQPEQIDNPIEPPVSGGDTDLPFFPPTNFPTIVGAGSGLIHVYNLTPTQFINFGKWLWVTYADTTIQKIWSNPMDGIIGAFELYITPDTSGSDYIRSGFLVSDVQGSLVNPRYKTINCGSIVVPEYYGNYLDYAPYTKAHICLPFIGIVELNSDDIIGHAVNVKYIVDTYNGSCIAQVTVAKTEYECMMYQYSGNCAVEVPLAGGSQAAIVGSLITSAASGLTSTIAGAITGGALGAGIGAIRGIGGIASSAVSAKASVQHSGTFGSSYGAMGPKKPYIIIHRPIEKQVPNYNNDYGFPAHKRVVIGACTGYLKVREVHVVSPTASDDEKAKIEELLKSGVFVS